MAGLVDWELAKWKKDLRPKGRVQKNAAYGQQSTLLYVCDQGVPILYHQSKQIPKKKVKEGQEQPFYLK